jgi:zinc transport system ATP-binding protein
MGSDPAIRFSHLTVRRARTTMLEGVNAVVPRGGSAAVVGPNGAGKTTLLLALLNQIDYQGRITLAKRADGHPLRVGYVPQRLPLDRGMPITVRDFMLMNQTRWPLWCGMRRAPLHRARALLAAVHAETLERRPLGDLSGGELQRVMLAHALQQEPDLLILDEPAAGIDAHGEIILCELLERLRAKNGFTQLMVSHDLATISHHATHVILLNRSVIAQGPPETVFTAPHLAATFGLHMGVLTGKLATGIEQSLTNSGKTTHG